MLGATQSQVQSSGARLEMVYAQVLTIIVSLGVYFGGVLENLRTLSNVK